MVKLTKEDLKAIIDGIWSRLSAKLAGKADSGHTHPAQTDVSGNAGTAAKLKTARKIGYASFDGSTNITLAQIGAAASGHTHENMTAATASAAGKAGLVPAPAAGTQTKFLRADGTWQSPPNTTYGDMKAATASAAGGSGLVPAPAAGAQAKFLRGDGTWQNPPNTTYGVATTSANGLMSSSDKSKLNDINMSLNRSNLAIGLNIPSFSSRGTGGFTAVGCYALKSLTTDAIGCTAIGCSALESNGGASFNTAVGSDTLVMTCGDGNTAIGYMAGGATRKTLGNNNTLIGHMADTSAVDVNNSMALGHQSSVSASNQISLGNSSITQLRCKVTSIASLSDKRVKEDIHPADTGICLKDVLRLPVTRYKYKDFTGTNLDNHVTGWMADDYEKVFPKGVQANDEMFPVLDENGNETFEEVIETRKIIDPETGEEKEVQEVRQQRKMFTLEKVKTITPSEALPTLWGAVQELAKQVENITAELNKLKASG